MGKHYGTDTLEDHLAASLKMNHTLGTSLVVQWLRLRAPNAGDTSLIPSQGTKIPHATQHGQKRKKYRQKLIILSPYDPAIMLLGIYPKELKTCSHKNLHMNV